MSDWKYNKGDVLRDRDGYWWHVSKRFECRDTGAREYYLWDATHTGDQYANAEYVEDDRDDAPFQSLGWSTDTKPAFERGFRVNGMLSEPRNVPLWFGNQCLSEHPCPNCGEETTGDADMITSYENQAVDHVTIRCQACGEVNEAEPSTRR